MRAPARNRRRRLVPTWWANTAQGGGYLQFKKVVPNALLKNFNADFGGQIYQQFTVGLTNGITDYIYTDKATLNVYPNPSDGHVYINIDLPSRKDGDISITDMLGNKVYAYQFKNLTADSVEADLSHLNKGVYFVTLRSGDEFVTKKMVIQ